MHYPQVVVTTDISLRRRRLLVGLGASAALPIIAACQAPAIMPAATATNPLMKPRAAQGAELTAVLASSELAVGRNRMALGLLDSTSRPITAGNVRLELFKVDSRNGTAQKRADASANFRSVGDPGKGTWVSQVQFDETGAWGVQLALDRVNEPPLAARLNVEVKTAFSAPGYGVPAPRTASLTLADVNGDASRLCSNSPPCDMHALSIEGALREGTKPLVVLFATPAFCTSATCGPELEVVQSLKNTAYGERANFVHVEIYKHPFGEMKPVAAVAEWKLPSEPWVFIVDRVGVVADRFEGNASAEELDAALRLLV